MEEKFSLLNKTRSKMPSMPFSSLKEDILGKNYSLSLAYITEAEMRKINKAYRKKDKATNVLSFPLSKSSGEILLCPEIIKKETGKFGRNMRGLLGFLVIQGMLHLKGMEHSSKMEALENKYDKKHFGGNRHRIHHD